jgi:hypothetical protein
MLVFGELSIPVLLDALTVALTFFLFVGHVAPSTEAGGGPTIGACCALRRSPGVAGAAAVIMRPSQDIVFVVSDFE